MANKIRLINKSMKYILRKQWFEYFEKKLISDLSLDINLIKDYQLDLAPIVYCSLLHKKVKSNKRSVHISDVFTKEDIKINDNWDNIKKIIEDGGDINEYMSKSTKDWKKFDYLLCMGNFSHIHIAKNKDGGIGKDLVFGVFTKDSFYALLIGDHESLYDVDVLCEIAERNFPNEFKCSNFNHIKDIFFNEKNIDYKYKTAIAHDDKYKVYGFNKTYDQLLVPYTLNDIKYGHLPFKVLMAYENEINHIEKIEKYIYETHKTRNYVLEIDAKSNKYVVDITSYINFKKEFPMKNNICSTFGIAN